MNEEINPNALSIYSQNDTEEDFPVLKAFQQYVDAEQNKARKRMIGLCAFFVTLMTIVIGVFLIMLYQVSSSKEQLYNRLLDSMREQNRQQMEVGNKAAEIAARAPSRESEQNAAAIKAVADSLSALQTALAKQAESKKGTTEVKSPSQLEDELKLKENEERLAREKAKIEAEKRKLALEKEEMHRKEVEQQRRRLYPEYYGEKTADEEKTVAPVRQRRRQLTDQDIQDILDEVDAIKRRQDQQEKNAAAAERKLAAEEPQKVAEEKPKKEVKSPSKAADKNADKDGADTDVDEDEDEEDSDAIEYFKDDTYEIPVDVKGKNKAAGWQIPLK